MNPSHERFQLFGGFKHLDFDGNTLGGFESGNHVLESGGSFAHYSLADVEVNTIGRDECQVAFAREYNDSWFFGLSLAGNVL